MSEEQTAEVATLNGLRKEIFNASKLTAEKAIELGGRLDKLRRSLGHGKWLRFVEAHLSFSDKTAGRYMKVFRNRKELADLLDKVLNFTLSDAYEFLDGAKKPDPDRHQAPPRAGVRPAADKNAFMEELSRSVRDQLSRLSAERISQFKEELLSFMQNWLAQHVGEGENEMESIRPATPVEAEGELKIQGLATGAVVPEFRSEAFTEGVTVGA